MSRRVKRLREEPSTHQLSHSDMQQLAAAVLRDYDSAHGDEKSAQGSKLLWSFCKIVFLRASDNSVHDNNILSEIESRGAHFRWSTPIMHHLHSAARILIDAARRSSGRGIRDILLLLDCIALSIRPCNCYLPWDFAEGDPRFSTDAHAFACIRKIPTLPTAYTFNLLFKKLECCSFSLSSYKLVIQSCTAAGSMRVTFVALSLSDLFVSIIIFSVY